MTWADSHHRNKSHGIVSTRNIDFADPVDKRSGVGRTHNTLGVLTTAPTMPTAMEDALSVPDANEWRLAMEKELHGIWEEGRFKDKEPPSNINPIKTRFVYKVK